MLSATANTTTIRAALLVCGTPIPAVLESFGDYPTLFNALLLQGLDELKKQGAIKEEASLNYKAFDVREDIYPENVYDWDLILISGSASNAYDDIPWINKLTDYIKDIPRDDKAPKVAGICFGHQIVGRAFGVQVAKNQKGWELGWTKTELSEEGQAFWGDLSLRIQELHQDIVTGIPEKFTVLASTQHTMNQSMISNDRRIVTLQGHPEFNGPIMKEFIKARSASGVFSKELAEASMSVVDYELDNVKMAARILQFSQEK
ncbi:hypothetical protein BGW38_010441 [Lunasporangiospora selenospora]|uniref:Glutamine amidotransferase domain-containing protein n=1 Tax=Lunasporangiospora selenospora TaxID=979761 RepID=A0A9P6FWW8_9FUNG|nr:hypothetical protein BGW38_010441 [Lunasporangiospora selenospora]